MEKNPLAGKDFKYNPQDFPSGETDVMEVFAWGLGAKSVAPTDEGPCDFAEEAFWKIATANIRSFHDLLAGLENNYFTVSCQGESSHTYSVLTARHPSHCKGNVCHKVALRHPDFLDFLEDQAYPVELEIGIETFTRFEKKFPSGMQWYCQAGNDAWSILNADRSEEEDTAEVDIPGELLLKCVAFPKAGPLLLKPEGFCLHDTPKEDSLFAIPLLGGKNPFSKRFEGVYGLRVWT